MSSATRNIAIMAWSAAATCVALFPGTAGLLWPDSLKAQSIAEGIDALARVVLWFALTRANPWREGDA